MTTLNILTRTSNRPKAFARCRDSVSAQVGGTDIHHIVIFDDLTDLPYLPPEDSETTIFHPVRGEGSFPANDYLTQAMKVCRVGWMMVLDDDCEFTRPTAVAELMSYVQPGLNMMLWRVQIGDKVFPRKCFGSTPVRRDIDNNGFMAATSLHNLRTPSLCVWPPVKEGDFDMIHAMYTHPLTTVRWVDQTFTKAQQGWGFGKREDLVAQTA